MFRYLFWSALTLAAVTVLRLGPADLPASVPPALATGATLYAEACAYCHGAQGQGGVRLSAPKLWGSNNVVSHSAYDDPTSLSQFIQHTMPLHAVNGINPGSLTAGQARSLAQYVLGRH